MCRAGALALTYQRLRMTFVLKTLAMAALVVAGTAQAASVNLLKNGSFEDTTISANTIAQYTPSTLPALFGWSVGAGGIELRHLRNFPSGFTHVAADGKQYVELAVERSNGSMWQDVFLKQGQEYTLKFAWSPRAPFGTRENQAAVSFNSLIKPLTLTADGRNPTFNGQGLVDMWIYESFTFNGNGQNNRLLFEALGPVTNYGMLFDDVSLTATPLPGAALLFGTSIAGFLAARKRRQAGQVAA